MYSHYSDPEDQEVDHHRRTFNLLVNAVVTMATVIVALAFWDWLEINTDPVPYDSVEVTSVQFTPDTLTFTANFQKLACEIDRVSVVGGILNETQVLDWVDEDGLPQDYDRGVGLQTLHMSINLDGKQWDWIEVRARHYCDGQRVSTVFHRFEGLI